jgi:hypothetical protein
VKCTYVKCTYVKCTYVKCTYVKCTYVKCTYVSMYICMWNSFMADVVFLNSLWRTFSNQSYFPEGFELTICYISWTLAFTYDILSANIIPFKFYISFNVGSLDFNRFVESNLKLLLRTLQKIFQAKWVEREGLSLEHSN